MGLRKPDGSERVCRLHPLHAQGQPELSGNFEQSINEVVGIEGELVYMDTTELMRD